MAESLLAAVAEAEELPKTKETLDELTKAASLQYSLKKFSDAADLYSKAVEIQAELNDEMAPENAELLFYYGRALYKVAVAKSDVLGNKVAQEDKKKSKSNKAAKQEGGGASSAAADGAKKEEKKEESVASKPYFQLTGDENWTDSEDDEDAEQEGEQEEEEDDFGNAYETFELARVLYSKQLDALEQENTTDTGKTKAELSPQARAIKEKIADCHGFLVEISLENERFHDAVSDARASLALQEELNPFEHENVTESHYSLSLALEFASVSKVREEQTGIQNDTPAAPAPSADDEKDVINWELRKEAAHHTELAIQSLQARLEKEEAALASDTYTPERRKEMTAVIQDKKSMLDDLKARVTDLKSDPTNEQYDSLDPTVFQGLLGGLLGADAATQKAKLAEATKGANDLTSLVKTKKKAKAPPPPSTSLSTPAESSSGKRKLEVEPSSASGKRAKTEEPL